MKRRWVFSRLAYYLFVSAAIGIVGFTLLYFYFHISYIWLLIGWLLIFSIFLLTSHAWKVKDKDVIRFLNQEYPDLENSAALLIMPDDSLNGLQRLQRKKIEQTFSTVVVPRRWNFKPLAGLMILIIAGLASFGFSNLSFKKDNLIPGKDSSFNHNSYKPFPPKISSIEINIQPPAYTGLSPKTQIHAEIRAEEDAGIEWTITVSEPVRSVRLLLNDVKVIPLEPANDSRLEWTGRLSLKTGGYYQIVVDSVTSSVYPIEMIKDQLPDIHVQEPKPETWIEYGNPHQVAIKVTLSDDYGIRHSEILATVSSGSGEAVKFQQHTISFSESFRMQMKKYSLSRKLDLSALAMKPGDELYFFIRAIDNKNQERRSDVFIVKLEDTAPLFSMDGLMTGVNLKPEYFRSQRQIIIETEQLIRDRSKLSETEFTDKSSSLGIDQKLLRLRYGKFLGEEAVTYESGAEEGEGHEAGEDDHEHKAESNEPGDVLSQFGHSHDNAEDATFFDPETKKQLRATLNEMWKAELQLRLARPTEALPFEYKALRLLKDLQQKSRVYVAKTSQKPTLLSNSKRLTGELDKIIQPVKHFTTSFSLPETDPLRRSLSVLSLLRNTASYTVDDVQVLKEAVAPLGRKAVESPARYISALESLRTIITSLEDNLPLQYGDILKSEQALQAMVSIPPETPAKEEVTSGILSDQYFRTLQQIQRR